MAVFGTSAGGGMTLALMLRAKQEGLPLPAAIAPGTLAADLTGTGDSYATNKYVDNNLMSYERLGWAAAKLYANSHDLKEPLVSPIFGDFTGLPPAIILTGTAICNCRMQSTCIASCYDPAVSPSCTYSKGSRTGSTKPIYRRPRRAKRSCRSPSSSTTTWADESWRASSVRPLGEPLAGDPTSTDQEI